MKQELDIVNPLEHADWDDGIAPWDGASVFHSRGWARTLAETYGFQPCYVVRREAGRLAAVLPLVDVHGLRFGARGVGLPYSDFCGALTRDPDDEARLESGARAQAAARHWRTIELRGPLPGLATQRAACTFYLHEVSLEGTEEEQWRRCRPGVRRAVRKARAAGLATRCAGDDEALAAFYRLHERTRRRQGLPPAPVAFFRALRRNLLDTGLGTVVTAARRGDVVAAAVFLRFGSQGLFKYGASDPLALADRPNDLVVWEGLRWCRGRGCRVASLGKTRLAQQGLRRFKLGWGADERTLDYHLYDVADAAYVAGRDDVEGWHNRLFRMMPLPLLRWAGQLLYRQAA